MPVRPLLVGQTSKQHHIEPWSRPQRSVASFQSGSEFSLGRNSRPCFLAVVQTFAFSSKRGCQASLESFSGRYRTGALCETTCFSGKFRRPRSSFLSRNEKRLRSQSPWYPWPPIAPVKRSFQLRVGGCGSHSVNRGRSVVTAPFGDTERCAESLLAMPNLSIAGRSRLLQGIAGGGRAREPGGGHSPRSVFAKACHWAH